MPRWGILTEACNKVLKAPLVVDPYPSFFCKIRQCALLVHREPSPLTLNLTHGKLLCSPQPRSYASCISVHTGGFVRRSRVTSGFCIRVATRESHISSALVRMIYSFIKAKNTLSARRVNAVWKEMPACQYIHNQG